jgi:hypothetical protein
LERIAAALNGRIERIAPSDPLPERRARLASTYDDTQTFHPGHIWTLD